MNLGDWVRSKRGGPPIGRVTETGNALITVKLSAGGVVWLAVDDLEVCELRREEMNKDQLIKALKAAVSELIERHAYSQGLSEEREGEIRELLATVPLTESEERIEAIRLEVLERSWSNEIASVRRATSVPEVGHPAWSTPEVPEVLADASGKVYKRTGDGNE